MPGDDQRTLFVISQIGEPDSDERKRADTVFEFIVSPVAERVGLRAVRSDQDPTPGSITTQIVRSTVEAAVVVADLTGRSPNVYLELGIAQSFAKPLVLLIDDPKTLPFDVTGERTITLGKGDIPIDVGERVKRELGASLDVVLAPEYQPHNLVTAAVGAQQVANLATDNPVAAQVAALSEKFEALRQAVVAAMNAPRVQVIDRNTLRRFQQMSSLSRYARHSSDRDLLDANDLRVLLAFFATLPERDKLDFLESSGFNSPKGRRTEEDDEEIEEAEIAEGDDG